MSDLNLEMVVMNLNLLMVTVVMDLNLEMVTTVVVDLNLEMVTTVVVMGLNLETVMIVVMDSNLRMMSSAVKEVAVVTQKDNCQENLHKENQLNQEDQEHNLNQEDLDQKNLNQKTLVIMARKLKPLLFPSSEEKGGKVNGIETDSGKPNLGFENPKSKQEHGLCYAPTLSGESGFVELRKFCEQNCQLDATH
ncbi:unnamed protein product [Sphenostylis stenocarpa]|uniref:Uncharacterized protein n=1 Tax=Sphenostylis stenocarpa TaxID=92480 RepID=A0AA86SDK6_9FABA|nr:unnamed protein product [Sphenostylis stenocarpa]